MNYIDTSHDLHIHNSRLYQTIYYENFALARNFFKKSKVTKDIETVQFVTLSRKHSIVTIVFSALSLEAFINTYALRNMSRSQFKKHYQYQNLYAKWAKIPKKITGTSISSSNLEKLKNLKELRDKLVHSEPEILSQDEKEFMKSYERQVTSILEGAEEAVETVMLLVRNLVAIDPDEQNYVWPDNQEVAS